jgi:hypothetical protein
MVWTDSQDYGTDEILNITGSVIFNINKRLMREIVTQLLTPVVSWYGGRPFLEDGLDKGFLGTKNNGKMKVFVEPDTHFKFGYLEAVNRVFSGAMFSCARSLGSFRSWT